MLFINGEHTTVDDFLKVISGSTGHTYTQKDLAATFKENPEYQINPIVTMVNLGKSRQMGRRVMKEPKGTDILARFRYFCPNLGKDIEVRYANTQPHYNESSKRMIYKPKAIEMPGPSYGVNAADRAGLEMMLFIYFHPDHSKSPFHVEGTPFKYTHINNDENFEQKKKKNETMVEALSHISRLEDTELVYYAKALNIDVTNRKPSHIRTLLQSFVIDGGEANLKAYSELIGNAGNVFIGRIKDAVDQGQIVGTITNGATSWSYKLKNNKNHIVTIEAGENAYDGLIQFVKANIAHHFPIVMGLAREAMNNKDYDDFFASQQEAKPLKPERPEQDPMTLDQVVDFASAKQFYHEMFNVETSAPKTVKEMLEAIQAGEATQDNYAEVLERFAPKSKTA